MAEFYDQPMFGARKLVDKGKPIILWELLLPNGVGVGYMEAQRQSVGVRILQATLKASYPLKIDVFNQKEQLLIRIEKIFAAGTMQVLMRNDKNQIIGALSQVPIKGSVEKGAYDYQVIDADKVLVGSLRGHWRANMLQIYDEKNNIIGKISRHDPSINRTVFAMGQRYHIVHVYFPPKNPVRRMLLLSIAAAIDILII